MTNFIEELFQPLFNKEVDYCKCEVIHSNIDSKLVFTKKICPVCNKKLRKEFMDNRFGLVVVSKDTVEIKRPTRQKYIDAILLNGINYVRIEIALGNKELVVDSKSLNTKNLKVRYTVNYDGIKYMDSEGFDRHNSIFRPFKPGKVRGYINNKNQFVIIKNA